jgi:hypothetical protein
MSNWLVAIVGGAIATVIGGVVLFHVLPAQPTPASIWPSAALAGPRYLKCTMTGGTMGGRVYRFSIDTAKKTAAWADYGIALNVVHFDEERVHTNAKIRLSDWPEHTHIGFNFNRLTLAVEGVLSRERSSKEVADCRAQPKGPWLNYCESPLVVGDTSYGACTEIGRAF